MKRLAARRDNVIYTTLHQTTLLTDRKNPRMRMRVQGRLMQASFIEIQQVFTTKIRSNTFLTK